MSVYSYTKSTVNIDKLVYEIEHEESIIAVSSQVVFNGPDFLDIHFILGLSDSEKTALDAVVAAHDGHPLQEYTGDLDFYSNDYATVVDQQTQVSGTFVPMQILVNARDLYNDSDNPLYNEAIQPILGENGLLKEHTDAISEVNNLLDYFYAESEGESSTTSILYQQKFVKMTGE